MSQATPNAPLLNLMLQISPGLLSSVCQLVFSLKLEGPNSSKRHLNSSSALAVFCKMMLSESFPGLFVAMFSFPYPTLVKRHAIQRRGSNRVDAVAEAVGLTCGILSM